MTSITLHEGDNRASLRRLINEGVRVHSVVTDPPYGLVSIQKRFGKEGAAAVRAERTEGNDGSFARLSGGFMGKCFHPDTEIMTKRGWKRVDRIEVGEIVATLDPQSRDLIWQAVEQYHVYPFDGELVHIKHRSSEQMITSNHKMLVSFDGGETLKFSEPGELKYSFHIFAQANPASGKTSSVIIESERDYGKDRAERRVEKEVFDSMTFFRFFGLWLGDGYTCTRSADHPANDFFGINVKKERKKEIVRKTLLSLGVRFTETVSDNGFSAFYIYNFALLGWLKQFGGAASKFIPDEFFEWDASCLEELYRGLIETDGTVQGPKDQEVFFTTSGRLADDFQRLCLHVGRSASVCFKPGGKPVVIEGHRTTTSDSWTCCVLQPGKRMYGEKSLSSSNVVFDFSYAGNVFCVGVPQHHIIYTRFNGKPVWTGNSWDGTGIERDPEFWRLIYEILLPGGYCFAFSGSRTGHWQAAAMETAGFVMHPMHGWVFGSGFPKAHSAKDAGPEWEGWAYGTQSQKPALEPIYLGQKPFSERTGIKNLLKHGVGAVNIDDCRVPTGDNLNGGAYAENPTDRETMWGEEAGNSWRRGGAGEYQQPTGRHPANLILDGSAEVVALFPDSKGQQGAVRGDEPSRTGDENTVCYGKFNARVPAPVRGDSGSAARFFHNFQPDPDPVIYNPKANKLDRGGSKHPCLLPGEDVLTDRGYRKIETLSIGDLVLSDDGTYRPIIDHFSSPADTFVYQIAAEGGNAATTATGNHPFLIHRPISKKRPFAKLNVMWADADELRVGDYLLTPVVSEVGDGSEDFVWWHIFGLWLAEGCRLTGGNGTQYPSLTVAKARNEDLLDLIRGRFGSVSAYDRGAAWQVVIFENGLIDRFVSMAGYGAKGKFISREILAQPEWARKAFLEGYLRGDGCVVRGAYRSSTASDDLAATLPLLSATLGMNCSSYVHEEKSSMIAGRTIPGGPIHKMYYSKAKSIEYDGTTYGLRRIKSIVPRSYAGPVWNITVKDRHTFQTRVGISHNTVKPIALMQYLVRHITPPGGVVLDPFAGSGTTAEAARREGFDCILMEAEPEYCDFLKQRFGIEDDLDHDLLGDAISGHPRPEKATDPLEELLG